MKRNLIIEIDCGTDTCSNERMKMCKYVWTKRFGTIYVCGLFDRELELDEETELLQRCWDCKHYADK